VGVHETLGFAAVLWRFPPPISLQAQESLIRSPEFARAMTKRADPKHISTSFV
jgi:hypothetical protein